MKIVFDSSKLLFNKVFKYPWIRLSLVLLLLLYSYGNSWSQAQIVKNINPSGSSQPKRFVEMNGILYFTAYNPTYGEELWRSDGTDAGTYMVKDICPGACGGLSGYNLNLREFEILPIGNLIYFTAVSTFSSTLELWKTDGTEAGTMRILTNLTNPHYLTNFNGKLAFSATGSIYKDLYVTDGTDAGTTSLAISTGGYSANPKYLTVLNNELYFSAFRLLSGTELWKSNGSTASLVKNINTQSNINGDDGSSPQDLRYINGKIYFTAYLGSTGRELWITDGTEAGTNIVKDINGTNSFGGENGQSGAFLYTSTSLGSQIIFLGNDGTTGWELWRSDGTSGGTFLLKDINAGTPGGIANGATLLNFGNQILFTGYDQFNSSNNTISGGKLWKTDGTISGTSILKPEVLLLPESPHVRVGPKVFFFGYNTNGYGLWETDGTSDGTAFNQSFEYVTSSDGNGTPYHYYNEGFVMGTTMLRLGNNLYISGDDVYSPLDIELWKLTISQVPPTYCTPAHNSPNCNADHAYIETVQIDYGNATFFKNAGSGCPLNSGSKTGYSEYLQVQGSLRPGITYNGKVINNAGGCLYTSVFIDYNIDGDFSDAGEMVFKSTTAPCGDGQTNTFSFLIPLTASSGTTRMRVRSVGDGEGMVTDPCLDYFFGETEDYTININPSASIAQNQTITLGTAAVAPRRAGELPYDPKVTASSALPVSYQSSDPTVVSVNGNLLTPLKPGVSTITVTQEGNSSFNGAPQQNYQLHVTDVSKSPFRNVIMQSTTAPNSLAFDISLNLYSASNSTIRVFNPSGTLLREIGTAGSADGQFSQINAITVDQQGNIYVVDALLDRIQVFNNQGVFLRKFGSNGNGNAQFMYATGIALDASNNIYIVDYNNHRIQKFSNLGVYISQFGNNGTSDGQFNGPNAIEIDQSGNIYVVDDSGRVQIFSSNGVFMRKFGSFGRAAGQFNAPNDINLDATGRIYIADWFNHRIQVFNNDGTYQYTVGSLGRATENAGQGYFFSLPSLAINSTGSVLAVADRNNNRVQVFGIPDMVVKKGTTSIAHNGTTDFGNINMLSNSGDVTFTVENPGTATLTINPNTSTLTGPNASDFVIDLTNAATGSFKVKFTPSATGLRSAQISIATNVLGKNPYIVNLSGTGVKNAQTITFNSIAAKTYGDAAFDLIATASSSLTTTFTSSNTSVATISGKTVTIAGAGTATITASQAGDANYDAAANVVQTLTVNKANQTITFGALAVKTFGNSAFDLTATSSSLLPVTFESSNVAVATISGATVTIVGGGSTTITATNAGNANYNPAPGVQQILIVNKASQTVAFATLVDRTLGDAPFSLTGTASSNLPLTFSTTSDKITITATQVAVVKAGRATITAAQPGNSSFAPATSVDRSFCIRPARPTISGSITNPESPVFTSSSASGNQWLLNGNIIVGATNSTISPKDPGIYTVRVTIDDCVSEVSLPQPLIITGDLESSNEVEVFPNPISDWIKIKWNRSGQGEMTATIFDWLGRSLKNETSLTDEILINASSLPSGGYILKLSSGEHFVTRKIIKD